MSTFHPDSHLRPLRGDAKRHPRLHQEGPLPPWHATVTVTPVNLQDWVFEVRARWEGGPPPAGTPAQPGMPPPSVCEDVINVNSADLAVTIAKAAGDQLRAGMVPDLLSLKRLLDRRARA